MKCYFRQIISLVARVLILFTIGATSPLISGVVHANTLHVASKSDIISLDPHALVESLQLDVLGNVYEPLVGRDRQDRLVPRLATSWRQLSPRTWRFELRKNVRFHSGESFGADDVIYSFQRAAEPKSGIQVFVGAVEKITKRSEFVVDFQLKEEIDQFPRSIAYVYIVSQKWCASHNCAFTSEAGDAKLGANLAFSSSGTGPYRLIERLANQVTRFERYTGYWGNTPQVQRVDFSVVADDTIRAQGLFDGNIDIALPFPIKAAAELGKHENVRVEQKAEARVLYLGMDVVSSELIGSDIRGANPFKDIRVRKAVQLAINSETLHHEVMRGYSRTLSIMIPQGVLGYDKELDKRPSYDPQTARRLLKEAGYAAGFQVRMNCSNDRYLNDEAICQAIVRDLAKIGIRVQADIEPKGVFFKKVFSKSSNFYLIGAATNSGDGQNIVFPVLGTPSENGRGELNFGGYRNDRIDHLLERLNGEKNSTMRRKLFSEVLRLQLDDLAQIPLHQQILLTGVRKDLTIFISPENGVPWRFVEFSKTHQKKL